MVRSHSELGLRVCFFFVCFLPQKFHIEKKTKVCAKSNCFSFTENGPKTGPESGLGMTLFFSSNFLYNDFQVPECIQNFQKAFKAGFEG